MADFDDGSWFYTGIGSAHGVGPEETPRPPTKAILWVPDPEQRHGWREYYVRRSSPAPKPGVRAFGFAGQVKKGRRRG